MTASGGFTGLLVDHAALEQTQADLRRAVQAIEQRLGRLDGELAPLRSEWSGQAEEAYRVSKARWDRAIHDMQVVLDGVGAGVARANLDYLAADRAAAATFQQI